MQNVTMRVTFWSDKRVKANTHFGAVQPGSKKARLASSGSSAGSLPIVTSSLGRSIGCLEPRKELDDFWRTLAGFDFGFEIRCFVIV